MPIEAGAASPSDRAAKPAVLPTMIPIQNPMMMSEDFARDAILAWYCGEFAAANAIIDSLCGHLALLGGASSEYDAVFSAIHRRRLNWIPVLQMQKYHSIADVTLELQRVAEKMNKEDAEAERTQGAEVKVSEFDEENRKVDEKEKMYEKVTESDANGEGEAGEEHDSSPDSDITDSGSQEAPPTALDINICANHRECEARPDQIKLTKGFSAKELVKGHMVNVVKGLKLYEDVFTDAELFKLNDFVNELREAGHHGELSGETFILFNKQMKGNKRELIQFGIPIFGQIKEEAGSNNQTGTIEPIPALLQDVIDHLLQWQIIPVYKKPNACIINFFDEGEYTQPFMKPPHLDQPISTLLLSESTMAFGRTLVSDNEGNYKGPLILSLKQGSLLVMRGNSADMARHVMCPCPNKRVSITLLRVRLESNQIQSPTSPPMIAGTTTLWQSGVPSPYAVTNGTPNDHEPMDTMLGWGVVRAPVVMLAPVRPMVLSSQGLPQGGTGFFLPWTMGSHRKHAKHIPPRAQKVQPLAIPSPVETHVAGSTSEAGIIV
ncbi:RNA demethylase ALKBH10B [Carya illinoinensis]|uniref:Fe2OG dioxygenase domain-containing protein n=1 Tax=Carya illinoinensis TaxID=32201 RepID=A0A922EBY1_CARIL|nr:RNA demethylase ALKBH10B [Carya illinoinensis]KAG6700255.1 hypothetical protein I3842_08G103000 [Carya illinoinensis]